MFKVIDNFKCNDINERVINNLRDPRFSGNMLKNILAHERSLIIEEMSKLEVVR